MRKSIGSFIALNRRAFLLVGIVVSLTVFGFVTWRTSAQVASADLALTKSDSPDPVNAGATISYTLTITNNGPDTAQSVMVTDTVPPGTRFVSAMQTSGPAFTITSPVAGQTGTVTATAATLASGGSATFTIVVFVNPGVPGGTVITNTATATSTTADPNAANNSSSVSTTVSTSADLSVTKIDTPDPVSAGQNIVYTVTIHNGGPSDAQAISFIDTLPAGTTFVTAFQTIGSTFALTTPPVDGTGTVSGTTATIFSTDDAIFVIVVKVNPGTPDGTVLTNTATATTVTSDPTPGNNTSTVSTTVMTTPPTSCDTYAATTSTGNAIVPGTNFIANSNCDDCSNPITLPFSFSYYGTPFTTANVISNGSLQFGSSDTTFTNTCLPVPGFNNAIIPHWDDLLLTGAGQGTFTSVTGSAPFRVFNIEWRGGYFSGVGAVDFEIRLYETTNQIDFVYGSVPQGGASATVGLQKGTGTVFSQFSCNTVSLSDGLKITYKCPNAASCNENFDTVVAPALPPGWTSTATGGEVPWVTSTTNPDTPPNDAFAPDPNVVGNTELITPGFIVSAGGSQVTFRNSYNTEATFDGMVLEISINGAPYQDILAAGGSFATGGYNGTISPSFGSPIAGRAAWTGNSGLGYITTTVNLPAAANGQLVRLKWRVATDVNNAGVGVRIDTITGISCAATAASVSVSGRVLTPDGRGLRNAKVTISDSKGVARTVTTSSFGFYKFDDVTVGESYIMAVQSKQYRFAQRVVQVFDTLTDVDFVGLE